jgi:hypothetical protein
MTPATIRLHATAERQPRWPATVWLPDGRTARLTAEDTGEPLGTVVDNPTASWPAAGWLLISLDTLDTLLAAGRTGELNGRRWAPLLPVERSTQLAAARDQVTAGTVGTPRLVEVTVPVGVPPGGSWEPDGALALTELEALVYGLRAAEWLTGVEVTSTSWVEAEAPARVALHWLGRVPVVHRTVPASLTAAAGLDGEVLGDRGRLLLGREFAPGALGIWERTQRAWRFPALPPAKHNVQAPDSAPGGWELAALLSDLAVGRTDRLCHHAIRLVSYVRRHTNPHRGGET